MKNLLPQINLENRNWGLDITRSIAIICVLFSHSFELISSKSYNWMYHFGVAGVEIFFVLSGFLIGGILIRIFEKEISLNALVNFWKRRWIRTLPNYYLALIIYAILALLTTGKNLILYWESYPLYFIFAQNSITPEPGIFGIAWSLSIEEWFYILFPLSSFILYKFTKIKSLIVHAFIFILGIVLIRAYFIPQMSDNFDLLIRQRMPFRLDSIVWGVIMAYAFKYKNEFIKKYKNHLFFLGLLTFSIGIYLLQQACSIQFKMVPYFSQLFMLNIYDLGIMCMIPFLYFLKSPQNIKITKFITWISLISYSLYLYHIIILKAYQHFQLSNELIFILLWPTWFIVSSLIYQYFEMPILKLREKVTKTE